MLAATALRCSRQTHSSPFLWSNGRQTLERRGWEAGSTKQRHGGMGACCHLKPPHNSRKESTIGGRKKHHSAWLGAAKQEIDGRQCYTVQGDDAPGVTTVHQSSQFSPEKRMRSGHCSVQAASSLHPLLGEKPACLLQAGQTLGWLAGCSRHPHRACHLWPRAAAAVMLPMISALPQPSCLMHDQALGAARQGERCRGVHMGVHWGATPVDLLDSP